MPSATPDSATISRTSSVMSVTCSPPVVTKCRSCWKTFIARRVYYPNPARRNELGPVAQRLEQRTHNPSVPGSNPGGPFLSAASPPYDRLCGQQPGGLEVGAMGTKKL